MLIRIVGLKVIAKPEIRAVFLLKLLLGWLLKL
jgi:hypothetical protein